MTEFRVPVTIEIPPGWEASLITNENSTKLLMHRTNAPAFAKILQKAAWGLFQWRMTQSSGDTKALWDIGTEMLEYAKKSNIELQEYVGTNVCIECLELLDDEAQEFLGSSYCPQCYAHHVKDRGLA